MSKLLKHSCSEMSNRGTSKNSAISAGIKEVNVKPTLVTRVLMTKVGGAK